jgi:hypothetical protein
VSSESDVFEQAKLFLPKNLTPNKTKELYAELTRFPNIASFYLSKEDVEEELLQGDGWRGFIAFKFGSAEARTVSGIIISNSCDISADINRSIPANILFAPLVSVGKYSALLNSSGKTSTQIDDTLNHIRKQKVTNIFYLPSHTDILQESLILLDDIHAHPLADFLGRDRTFLIRLNQTFFYIFLIKLSIHFSRFMEGVQRFPSSQ